MLAVGRKAQNIAYSLHGIHIAFTCPKLGTACFTIFSNYKVDMYSCKLTIFLGKTVGRVCFYKLVTSLVKQNRQFKIFANK